MRTRRLAQVTRAEQPAQRGPARLLAEQGPAALAANEHHPEGGRGDTAVHTSDRRLATAGAWLQPRFSVTRDDTPQTLVRAALVPRPLHRRAALEAKGLLKRWR